MPFSPRTKPGTASEAEEYVRALYEGLLHREPGTQELEHWTGLVRKGMTDRDAFYRFLRSDEFKNKDRVIPGHPLGHYYSPIVDPAQLRSRPLTRHVLPEAIHGIEVSLDRMRRWWRRNLATLETTSFPDLEDSSRRYYARNAIYPYGDAAVLRAMIISQRPRRIIEIGSGFSSACMLDTIDEAGLKTELTFIEPETKRLFERMRPGDLERVRVLETEVQDVSLDEFAALRSGDILFIDSSHVLKTGSDVHYELFEILPILKRNIMIHFHDVAYPFEYPDEWIFKKGYSWNEAYAVRAFLMYNRAFRVEFMTSAFAMFAPDSVEPTIREFSGGSLWVKKIRRT